MEDLTKSLVVFKPSTETVTPAVKNEEEYKTIIRKPASSSINVGMILRNNLKSQNLHSSDN